ncbi:hypothetical protein FA15DRAFT_674014 [Coprinopsis marcescibilis]|uniref:Uncharacterized protein n=1 Tax=Coprinopsis marcescibilis TaxID=230819 RepID=A0A5C3KIQ6_COPMA|nr:hypothetical protein FA15DRAFT_674014 [Coprinopsis marcescibilis]
MLARPSTLLSLTALIAAQIANAVDIRVYQTSDNCNANTFIQCSNVNTAACCTTNNGRSAFVTGNFGTVTAYDVQACGNSGPRVRTSAGRCLWPGVNFVIRAVKWEPVAFPSSARQSEVVSDGPDSEQTASASAQCLEANSFGYIDEVTGEEVIYTIPDDRRAAILDAVGKGDRAALKANSLGLDRVQ